MLRPLMIFTKWFLIRATYTVIAIIELSQPKCTARACMILINYQDINRSVSQCSLILDGLLYKHGMGYDRNKAQGIGLSLEHCHAFF